MDSGLSFDLALDPNPRFVSIVRRFVEEVFERLIPDPEAVFRVSMTAHELLENAAKYATADRALLRFSTRLEGDHAQVTLSLINDTTGAHIDQLRQRVQAIAGAADAFAHYQKLMLASSRVAGESGLGLARIAAEAEMSLGLEVKENTVAIMASTQVDLPGRMGIKR
jgi:two-component sensor histidine kinase